MLSCSPAAARRSESLDHFGNRVAWLFLDLPHPVFEIVAEATVDVRFPDPPRMDLTPPWEEVVAIARAAAEMAGARRSSCSRAR